MAGHGTDPAAPGSRRGRARAAASRDIRQAARRILVRHGREALTLRAIAREAGMTAPALYRYGLVALEVSGYPAIASLTDCGTMHADPAWTVPGLAGW